MFIICSRSRFVHVFSHFFDINLAFFYDKWEKKKREQKMNKIRSENKKYTLIITGYVTVHIFLNMNQNVHEI